jgi:hypothetical protein
MSLNALPVLGLFFIYWAPLPGTRYKPVRRGGALVGGNHCVEWG